MISFELIAELIFSPRMNYFIIIKFFHVTIFG